MSGDIKDQIHSLCFKKKKELIRAAQCVDTETRPYNSAVHKTVILATEALDASRAATIKNNSENNLLYHLSPLLHATLYLHQPLSIIISPKK